MQLSPLPRAQMLWIEGHLSIIEKLSMRSWLANGHEVILYHYRPLSGVPDGVTLRDAREIVPENVLDRSPRHLWGVFSDIFRYHLLYQKGGIWCDADIVLLKPLEIDAVAIASELSESGGAQATGCLLALPKEHWIAKACIAACRRIKWDKDIWGTTGPALLSEMTDRHDLYRHLLHPDAICPIPTWQISNVVRNEPILLPNSSGVHLYNECWRRAGLDPNAEHHPNSLFERLKRRYLS
ncbi:MAG: glycosyltransferase [Hyphomicrobiaceae bacterium]